MMKALFAILFFPSIVMAAALPFRNLDIVAANTGIDNYASVTSKRTVKIAILDNGFAGREALTNVTYHAGPIAVDAKTEEQHGTYMAQIVSGLLERTPNVSYELHLFSAFGYSNLKQAVESVVSDKFDLVLYSQVWEYGGNGDGRGFINSLVDQATQAGIVWINASGNFGNATYKAPVFVLPDLWAMLPSPNHGVKVRCFENTTKKCNLRAVLSWSDFKDQPEIGTDKDLDLVLVDDTTKVIRTGGLQQVVATPQNAAGTSLYPREIVEAELTPGLYELRVKVRSQNFSKDVDTLKIVTSGDYIQQLDISDRRETLLAPADNSGVITVGASDSDKSSASASMGKPEVSVASEVMLNNGDTFKGSSNSAAMTAALAAVAKAQNPSASKNDVLDFLSRVKGRVRVPTRPVTVDPTGPIGRLNPSTEGRSEQTYQELGFGPTGANCFVRATLFGNPVGLVDITDAGAVATAVQTNAGIKIMVNVDPFSLDLGVQRTDNDSMLTVGPKGLLVFSRNLQLMLAPGQYEVLQQPKNASFCR